MRWIKKTISFLIIVNFLISPSLAMKRGLPLDQELPRKTAYILTVAGGGVRGVIPARVLSLLEERVIAKVNRTQPPGARKHVNFAELFDVVSGTSTGGIIIAGLNSRIHINSGKPKTPKDILQFYKNHAHTIFPPQNMFQKLGGLFSSKYSQEPLANLLKDTVGEETWISDTFTEMIIPTYDMRQGVSYLFKSSAAREHDSENFRTYEALLATAAAPTYFNAVPITSKDGHSRLFSDGGIAMNNPMLEAMTAASKKFPHHNLFFIALGTGRVPLGSYASLREAGLLKYAPKLPALLMKNNERRARIAFEHIKGMIEREGRTATCYFIDPFLPLELAAMDSADTVDDLIAIGDRVANEANYEEYPDFEKAVDALVCAYEEKFPLQRKGSFSIISLDNDQTEDTIKKTPLVQKLPPKNLFFVQRESYRKALKTAFEKGEFCPTLTGVRGSGKSQLAKAHAYEFQSDYDLIWWFNAGLPLEPQYRDLCEHWNAHLSFWNRDLSDDEKFNSISTESEPQNFIGHINNALRRVRKDWLLVFDDAPHENEIKRYFPQVESSPFKKHLLVTSKNSLGWTHPIETNSFDPENSVELLEKVTKRKDEKGVRALAETLKHFPLAIAQAAGYIQQHQSMSYEGYQRSFLERRANLWRSEERFRATVGGYDDYKMTFATAFRLTLDEIEKRSPLALQLLHMCVFVHHQNIPEVLFVEWVKQKGKDPDFDLAEAISELSRFSILQVPDKEASSETDTQVVPQKAVPTYSVHELLQIVLRDTLPPESAKENLKTLLSLFVNHLQFDESNLSTWPLANSLTPHVVELINHAETFSLGLIEEKATILVTLGKIFRHQSLFVQSLEFHQKALKQLGRPHAGIFFEIGRTYGNLGNYPKQLEFFNKALMLFMKPCELLQPAFTQVLMELLHSVEHKDLISYVGKLKFFKSEIIAFTNLCKLDPVLHTVEIALATTLHQIGCDYGNMLTDFKQLQYLEMALLMFEQIHVSQPNHPHIATVLHEVGRAYGNLGDFEKKLEYLKRALTIKEEIHALEPNHPNIGITHYEIGIVYGNLGKYTEQLNSLNKAYNIIKEAYPHDHPSKSSVLYELGRTYGNLKDYKEQTNYLKDSLAMDERMYGAKASNAQKGTTLHAIGEAYGNLGDYPNQLEHLQKSLAMFEKLYAPELNHPYIVNIRQLIEQVQKKFGG